MTPGFPEIKVTVRRAQSTELRVSKFQSSSDLFVYLYDSEP